MSESRAVIFGCEGPALSDAERAFFHSVRPWAFILFARNINSFDQVRRLTADLRSTLERDDALIFIDQEGGRVQRIVPPLAARYPPAAEIGALFEKSEDAATRAAYLMGRLHAFDLLALGINANCLPVLDVPGKDSHSVIGDRAFGRDPQAVARLGAAMAQGLMAGGVLPVMKHVPGHGRAGCDSHLELPRVDTALSTLMESDFLPFRALRDLPMAMTAHVVYAAIDPVAPATLSPLVVSDIIRDAIGFDGLLMSDDLSMQALAGSMDERAAAVIRAGVDIVLHCNGDIDEMKEVAISVPMLGHEPQNEAAKQRALHVQQLSPDADNADEAAVRAEFHDLTGVDVRSGARSVA